MVLQRCILAPHCNLSYKSDFNRHELPLLLLNLVLQRLLTLSTVGLTWNFDMLFPTHWYSIWLFGFVRKCLCYENWSTLEEAASTSLPLILLQCFLQFFQLQINSSSALFQFPTMIWNQFFSRQSKHISKEKPIIITRLIKSSDQGLPKLKTRSKLNENTKKNHRE